MRSEAFFTFSRGAYTIFFAWRGRKYNLCDSALSIRYAKKEIMTIKHSIKELIFYF